MYILKHKLLLVAASIALSFVFISGTANAAVEIVCPDGYTTTAPTGGDDVYKEKCANHQTGTSGNDQTEAEQKNEGNKRAKCEIAAVTKENCGIISYLVTLINVLSGLVGIVIVIMITVGGIQYSTARDNPQAAVAAKQRITNALIALVFFLFTYAFLQYIVPGGVL